MLHSRFIKVVSLILLISFIGGELLAQYEATQVPSIEPVALDADSIGVALQEEPAEDELERELSYVFVNIEEARIAGERDAKGNLAFGLGGFAVGLPGLLIAGMYNPTPDTETMRQIVQNNEPEYAEAYRTSYSKKTKKKNLRNAGIGWGLSVAASAYLWFRLIEASEEESW